MQGDLARGEEVKSVSLALRSLSDASLKHLPQLFWLELLILKFFSVNLNYVQKVELLMC